MEKNNKSGIDRRKFFKVFGTGAAVSAAAFYGCKNNAGSSVARGEGEIPTDKMTYRTSPTTGDKVSLLGYGCMRLPTIVTTLIRIWSIGSPIMQ